MADGTQVVGAPPPLSRVGLSSGGHGSDVFAETVHEPIDTAQVLPPKLNQLGHYYLIRCTREPWSMHFASDLAFAERSDRLYS